MENINLDMNCKLKEQTSRSPEKMILIVDDEPEGRLVLAQGLRALGFACETAGDAMEAIAKLAEKEFALMLTDLGMPRICGMKLLEVAREAHPDLAVIIATAADDRGTAVEAMREGAYDYIVKPFTLEEIRFSVTRALEKRQLELEVQAHRRMLERKVRERTRALKATNDELQRIIVSVIESIAMTLEVRDEYTAQHSDRVATLSVQLAEQLDLDEEAVERVRMAALLHDIGKIGIRESVLHKEGRLTFEEMEHIKTHPLVAEQILQPIKPLKEIIPSIKHEHEAYDGTGYPDGIAGEEIPLEARIIAVADAYDALTSDRPYRPALSHQEAIRIMRDGAGRTWDPYLVQKFEEMTIDNAVLPNGEGKENLIANNGNHHTPPMRHGM